MVTPRKADADLVRRHINDLEDLRLQIERLRPKTLDRSITVGHMWDVLAARYGCSARTVQRVAIGEKMWEPTFQAHTLTPQQWVTILRIRTLNPGMPSTWVAETAGVHYSTIAHYFGPCREDVMVEWLPVWQSIRRNDVLLALHHEFAPPTIRANDVRAGRRGQALAA